MVGFVIYGVLNIFHIIPFLADLNFGPLLVFLFLFLFFNSFFNSFFGFFPFCCFLFLHPLLSQRFPFNFWNLKIFSTSFPFSTRVLKYLIHFNVFFLFLHSFVSFSIWWSFSHCHLKRDQWIRFSLMYILFLNLIDKPVAISANRPIFMTVQKTFTNHSTPFGIFLFHTFFLICFVLLWPFRSFALFLFPSYGFRFWLHTWVGFFLWFWLTHLIQRQT